MPIINGRYVNPGWVNGQPPAINASELNAVSDTLERLTSPGGRRGGYVVVGTSTEGATAFDCDFLCDGTADDVEINAAIEMAKTLNLGVFLLPGTYNITDTIILFGEMCGSPAANTILTRTSVSFDYLIQMNTNSYLHEISTDVSSTQFESTSTAEIYALGFTTIKNVHISSPPYIGILNDGDATSPSGYYQPIVLDSVSMFSAEYSFQLKRLTGELSPCYIRNCAFSGLSELLVCGAVGTSGVSVSGNSFHDLNISNCVSCSVYGNRFDGNVSLSQSGSSAVFPCASNIISTNIFSDNCGISLGTNTERNLVIGNGGGTDEWWAGVTDNGSNNYVANNMPTS